MVYMNAFQMWFLVFVLSVGILTGWIVIAQLKKEIRETQEERRRIERGELW